MKPQFSEFSYGYAVTQDMVRLQGTPLMAPEFPSLKDEGKSKGNDVRLDLPGSLTFMQFKLSHYMKGGNAVEARRGILTVLFYRMYLMPLSLSRQLDLLLGLQKPDSNVYYVAPCFHTPDEFNQAYRNRTIVRDSFMIKVGDIGNLDNDEHTISFKDAHATEGYLLSSDERRIPVKHWESVVRELVNAFQAQKEPLRAVLLRTESLMLELLTEYRKDFPEKRIPENYWRDIFRSGTEDDLAVRLASISQIFFGCALFVVQPPRAKEKN